MQTIIITGPRGSGKSSTGKIIAELLKKKFIDIDEEIEKEENMKTSEIVANHGWDYFRNLEHEITKKVSKEKNCIIATGGGTLIFERNQKVLKKTGPIILITCETEIAAQRIQNCTNRPSLSGKKDFIKELHDIWAERKDTYFNVSDIIINASYLDPKQAAIKAIEEIRRLKDKSSNS